MRISDSSIRLSSQREYRQEIEAEASRHLTFRQALAAQAPAEAVNERERLAKVLERLIEAILAALDGRKCRSDASDCRPSTPPAPAGGEREVEWGWEVHERISESEQTAVEASGIIHTADGRSIDFSLFLDMQRAWTSEVGASGNGKAVLRDPLVINFEGKAADLTSERIDFDLDGDGHAEKLPGLGAASGYLVLDRNGNGKADDGRELFGVASGDGFADLAALDADHNGWIDENDPAYGDLAVWGGGAADGWRTLKEAKVGALWLESVSSAFSVRDSTNGLLGEIRATGLWLQEDGKVGTLQQVDLATESPAQAGSKESSAA